MKKILLIIIIFLLGGGIYFFFFQEKENVPPAAIDLFPASDTMSPPPQKEIPRIKISTDKGDVVVNNFAPVSKRIDANTFGVDEQVDYSIVYHPSQQSFSVVLIDTNVRSAQNNAENAILSILDITKEDACKLNITVAVPYSYAPHLAGKIYSLSFCPDGIPFPGE